MTGATRAFAMLFVALHILALFAYTLRWLWVSLLAIALLIHAARAHEWYDPECCSGEDCRPVHADELIETEKGWKHLPSGIEFRKDQVRPSKDRHFHICVSKHGTPYCIYILQGT